MLLPAACATCLHRQLHKHTPGYVIHYVGLTTELTYSKLQGPRTLTIHDNSTDSLGMTDEKDDFGFLVVIEILSVAVTRQPERLHI